MAEQKLFKQLGEDNEPVSSVPAQSEYTEKYDPSPIAGILGLTAAGAGAVALRTPIGRLINKTIKIKPPKLQAPRTTEPSDEVSGILATVPSKTQRAESVTSTAIDKVKQEAAQIKARSDELKKLRSLTKKRKIFLAASTHPGEEEIIKNITLNLKKNG